MGEQCLEAGKVLFAWIASANRDEAQFPNANQFTIEREPWLLARTRCTFVSDQEHVRFWDEKSALDLGEGTEREFWPSSPLR
jgi:cytochrome P450